VRPTVVEGRLVDRTCPDCGNVERRAFGGVRVDARRARLVRARLDVRAQALAHEDLPFVWFVADEVIDRDWRAAWMAHWLLETTAHVTEPVSAGTAPVRHVVLDADGDWQLLCGTVAPDAAHAHIAHLYHALDADPTLLDVLDLEPGWRADRTGPEAEWTRSPDEEE
jgi:hypothetical protein